MTKRLFVYALSGLLTFGVSTGRAVAGDCSASASTVTNAHCGDNSGSGRQRGRSSSGDANAGQIVGTVSAGASSIDATNRSGDVSVRSGRARAANRAATATGHIFSEVEAQIGTSDFTINNSFVFNVQEGDNETDLTQTAAASSGDGVGGQVIGVVTSAGGSAGIVAANTSQDADVETGNAEAISDAAAFVGLLVANTEDAQIGTAGFAILSSAVFNAQEGDNSLDARQSSSAASGDGVGGQILGVVSAGQASVDATNRSQDVDVETGDAGARARTATATGLATVASDVLIGTSGFLIVEGTKAFNAQEGDNLTDISQSTDAATGDGVGGQVAGVVTSPGGVAEVVASNTSEDVDIDSGDAEASSEASSFVGLLLAQTGGAQIGAADFAISASFVGNAQKGDNSLEVSQSADASSGDGVGGQVLGVVSAGAASVDAQNRSLDVDVETGDAEARNRVAAASGLVSTMGHIPIGAAGFAIEQFAFVVNAQQGANDADISQSSSAATGDGVGGQVIGVVTTTAGTADVVADNTSQDVDVESGDAEATNDAGAFVGLAFSQAGEIQIGVADFTVLDSFAGNAQEGDNSLRARQSADASSGDGVGGQVLGLVAGGQATVDATNRSEDIGIETGDARAANTASAFVGLAIGERLGLDGNIGIAEATIIDSLVPNAQSGDNDARSLQGAEASSGDAVGGQVGGIVVPAGGTADLVVANATDGAGIESGRAVFRNDTSVFVGLFTLPLQSL